MNSETAGALHGLSSFWGNWLFHRKNLQRPNFCLTKVWTFLRSSEIGAVSPTRWATLGHVFCYRAEYAAARKALEESLVIFRELEDRQGAAHTLARLGDVACGSGDYAAAQSLYRESIGILRMLNDNLGVAKNMEGLAAVMLAQAAVQKAVHIWGAIHALRGADGDAATSL